MGPFGNAPIEIISHILSFLPSSELPNVCRVDKSLNSCAEPLLYSAIGSHWTCSRVSSIFNLLCTLFRRPHLLACIDTLALDYRTLGRGNPLSVARTPDAISELVSVIRTFDVPFADLWVEKLRAGNVDAFAALLIARLTRTRCLIFANDFADKLVGKVLKAKVSGKLPRFQRLNVMVYINGLEYPLDAPADRAQDSLALFYLPAVTHLALWMRNPDIFHWPNGEPNLDHLTSLDIEGCCVTFLTKILALTRNLTSLSWTLYYSFESSDPWITGNLELDNIIAALLPVKHTLTRLQFRLAFFTDPSLNFVSDELNITGSFSGLADFDRLDVLDVPIVCLAGFGILPEPLDRYIPRNISELYLSSGMLTEWAVQWTPNTEDTERSPDKVVYKVLKDFITRYPTRLTKLWWIELVDDMGCFQAEILDCMLEEHPLGLHVFIDHFGHRFWQDYYDK